MTVNRLKTKSNKKTRWKIPEIFLETFIGKNQKHSTQLKKHSRLAFFMTKQLVGYLTINYHCELEPEQNQVQTRMTTGLNQV